MNDGVMLDSDVIAGLEWLASTQEKKTTLLPALSKSTAILHSYNPKSCQFRETV